jgi:hypothetical protein
MMKSQRLQIGGILVLAAALAMLPGCASLRNLHGVGARSASSGAGAVLDQSPQQLAASNGNVDAALAANANPLAEAPALEAAPVKEDVAISHEMPPMPQMGANRETALAEIRDKAGRTGNGKTDVFAGSFGSARQLTAQDQASMKGDLDRKVSAVDSEISEAEVKAKQAESELLRRRAARHYQDALNRIEK